MAKFIQMEGNDGIAANGNRIVPRTYLERTWQAGVAVPPDPALPPEVSDGLPSYALGWFVGDYGRLTMLSHSGGPYDFTSEAAFLPEANLGIAVLTNDAACGALAAFAAQYRLFALLLDQELAVQYAFDAFLASVNAQRLAAAIALGNVEREAVTPLLGTCAHPALGTIELRLEEDALHMDAAEVRSRLRPLHSESGRFVRVDPPLAGAPATFSFADGPAGRLRPTLTVRGEPGEPPNLYPLVPVARANSVTHAAV